MWSDWLTEKGDISDEWLDWFVGAKRLGRRIMVGATEPIGMPRGYMV